MTFSPRRHDLPTPLVSSDAPLSADVMSRSVESIDYLWQVTTNCIDSAGTACTTIQGHTHDGRNDQALTADSQYITGWSFGFGSPYLQCSNGSTFVNHLNPFGGWNATAGMTTIIRSMVHVPFDVTLGNPNCAQFVVHALIEKGVLLSVANSVSVMATVGGVALIGTSANAAPGLEIVTIGPFAAGALVGGPQSMEIALSSALSADYARLWHASAVTA